MSMRPKVLVVEDEPAIADAVAYALETDGFEPRVVGTGHEALEAAGEGIDFVVLDVGLPDASGFEVCKRIRAVSAVPILFLTARQAEVDRVVGLEIGGDDYLVKPFSPRELTARIKAVLRRARPQAQAPASAPGLASAPAAGAFAVDDERRSITYRGAPLELSRYEYGLLRVMIRRPGKVFTRDDLMMQVWEEPGASLDRTVDAHIKALRAKLRAAGAVEDPIVTHRGVGYALRDTASS